MKSKKKQFKPMNGFCIYFLSEEQQSLGLSDLGNNVLLISGFVDDCGQSDKDEEANSLSFLVSADVESLVESSLQQLKGKKFVLKVETTLDTKVLDSFVFEQCQITSISYPGWDRGDNGIRTIDVSLSFERLVQ